MKSLVNYLNLLILSLFSLFLMSNSGCNTVANEDKNKNQSGLDDEYQTFWLKLKGTKTGVEVVDKTNKYSRIIELTPWVRDAQIKKGELVEIKFIEIDFKKYALETYVDSEENINISLIPKTKHYVELVSECDVVEIRGIQHVPTIKVKNDLKPDQITITPIFDDDCKVIGFQIVYGSNNKCKDVINPFVSNLKKCLDLIDPAPQQQPPPLCPEKKWFNVPCPKVKRIK